MIEQAAPAHNIYIFRSRPNPQPSVIKKFTRTQKLTLISLALVDFMSFCSMSIMAPFFPKEAAAKGMSDTVSGFVFSFYALIMVLSSPVFGKFVSTLENIKNRSDDIFF